MFSARQRGKLDTVEIPLRDVAKGNDWDNGKSWSGWKYNWLDMHRPHSEANWPDRVTHRAGGEVQILSTAAVTSRQWDLVTGIVWDAVLPPPPPPPPPPDRRRPSRLRTAGGACSTVENKDISRGTVNRTGPPIRQSRYPQREEPSVWEWTQ